MVFRNRLQAAQMLAERLGAYASKNPLVLAIPRGAVPMGKLLADALAGELDVVLVRKLGAPGNPEYAIGAVDESGWVHITPFARAAGADPAYIERQKEAELQRIRQRRSLYSPLRPALDPAGRIVIVVDDGLATGSTMIAALHAVRSRNPARLICAVPVAPPDTVQVVAQACDEVVCLDAPEHFQAVGQFYRDFSQVEDDDVARILAGGGIEGTSSEDAVDGGEGAVGTGKGG